MSTTDFTPVKRRVGRRRRHEAASSPAPAGPPVLVAATWDTSDGAVLTLTFDRAVNIAGLVGSDIRVTSEPLEGLYAGSGALLVDPVTVRIEMTLIDTAQAGTSVLLLASAGNGIVSADGGEAWAGADDLELPFP